MVNHKYVEHTYKQFNLFFLLYNIMECVVAIGNNLGISTENDDIPWKLPDDLKHFKNLTKFN